MKDKEHQKDNLDNIPHQVRSLNKWALGLSGFVVVMFAILIFVIPVLLIVLAYKSVTGD